MGMSYEQPPHGFDLKQGPVVHGLNLAVLISRLPAPLHMAISCLSAHPSLVQSDRLLRCPQSANIPAGLSLLQRVCAKLITFSTPAKAA